MFSFCSDTYLLLLCSHKMTQADKLFKRIKSACMCDRRDKNNRQINKTPDVSIICPSHFIICLIIMIHLIFAIMRHTHETIIIINIIFVYYKKKKKLAKKSKVRNILRKTFSHSF